MAFKKQFEQKVCIEIFKDSQQKQQTKKVRKSNEEKCWNWIDKFPFGEKERHPEAAAAAATFNRIGSWRPFIKDKKIESKSRSKM